MHYFHWIAGTILALAWFSRIVDAALGMPSVADVSKPEWDRDAVVAGDSPRVSIIVPARNEEEHIESSLRALLALDYDNYEVIAVNDRSTDRTGEIMERMAGNPPFSSPQFSQGTRETGRPLLLVIHHRELPAGWLGKTHAMWTATNQANGDWLLFTDADVLFKPESVRRALAYGEAERADPGDKDAMRAVGLGVAMARSAALAWWNDFRFRPRPLRFVCIVCHASLP